MRSILAAIMFVCALSAPRALAQGIGVSPVYLELRPEQGATSVRVENRGAAARSFEVDVRAWAQHNGRDALSETRAFIVSPSVFEVAPHATQIVRLARRPGQAASPGEQSFRVLVREIPAEGAALTANGLRLHVELSLPLFAIAEGAAPDLAARWTQEGLELVNTGAAHARLAHVRVGGRAVEGAPRYLLAGQSFVRPAPARGDVEVRLVGAPTDLVLDAPSRDRAR